MITTISDEQAHRWVKNSEEPPCFDDYNEDDVKSEFVDEVHQWCVETFGKAPRVFYFDDPFGYDLMPGWQIWFQSKADLLAFKLKWL